MKGLRNDGRETTDLAESRRTQVPRRKGRTAEGASPRAGAKLVVHTQLATMLAPEVRPDLGRPKFIVYRLLIEVYHLLRRKSCRLRNTMDHDWFDGYCAERRHRSPLCLDGALLHRGYTW